MSLDANLFTLNIVPDARDAACADLVDPAGRAHYRRRLARAKPYEMELYDPHSQALLATARGPEAGAKIKSIELHNPPCVVPLRSVGTLSFKWSFKWEDHEFAWKRESCFLLRAPDPDVLVAVTKEPPGRLKTASVQILDYNLARFDVSDRKGLEIALLAALLTFQDLNGVPDAPPPYADLPASTAAPPTPPPRPEIAAMSGIDRVAEMQAARGEVNEVLVAPECGVADYAAYAAQLLEDPAMLFVSVRSGAAAEVPKVLAVVEEAKRIRHRAGAAEALHQYVVYDYAAKRPERIKLDDPPKEEGAYKPPPDMLTVHLSKIDMPELKPRPKPTVRRPARAPTASASGPPTPPASPKEPAPSSASPGAPPRKLKTRRSSKPSNSPSPAPTPPAPTPHAPRPSPSQLNNPSLFVAEPPKSSRTSFWRR